MNPFLPTGGATGAVVVPAPGSGWGRWAGAPSAALDQDGSWVLAYRLRSVEDGLAEVVVVRSEDGQHLTPVATVDRAMFGAMSLERPALVRTPHGPWRLYVCCATPGTKHWWIEALEADDPACLPDAERRMVLPGDERTAVKDPVVRFRDDRWEAWICCHPLDEPGEEDRMTTAYATSLDGLDWTWHGTALAPRPGTWDARGARVTAVLPDGRATYDGRATKEENFKERTGRADPAGPLGKLAAIGDGPASDARYLDVVPLPGGGYRVFYEWPLPDGSHELRTELVTP